MILKTKKGFTLIEVIITIAVASILLGAAVSFFVFMNRLNNDQKDFVFAQDTVRTVSRIIENDIRKSNQVANDQVIGSDALGIETDPYVIKLLSSEVEYYLKDNIIYRNGAFLLDNVEKFIIMKSGNKVTYIIESNVKERMIEYEQEIYLRP